MTEIRLDTFLGRVVRGVNNQSVGRIEEIRAVKHGTGATVTAYVIGEAGLLERLDLGARLLMGRGRHGLVARGDQMDISDPHRPRLTCPVEELERL